jgi:tetratricopeptide (TPR) repeat protein
MFNIFRRKTWEDHFNAGMRYGSSSNLARAEASFREAARLAPDEPYPHYQLGYTLSLTGRYEEALPEFRRTNELQRGFFLVQVELFLCEQVLDGQLSQQGLQLLRALHQLTDRSEAQTVQAVKIAQHAIEVAPRCALAHFYLGKALLQTDPVKAEETLRTCLELGPDETTAIDAKIHLGTLRQRADDMDEARRIWRGVIADYPGHPLTTMCEFVLAHNESH